MVTIMSNLNMTHCSNIYIDTIRIKDKTDVRMHEWSLQSSEAHIKRQISQCARGKAALLASHAPRHRRLQLAALLLLVPPPRTTLGKWKKYSTDYSL